MNERIRDIGEQAMSATFNKFSGVEWSAEEWRNFYDTKFAELLIQECCEQLVKEGESWEQFSRNPPKGQEHHTTGALFAAYRLKEDAVDMLREHFGVEE